MIEMKMVENIIDFLVKISNIATYIANFLRERQLHEEYYVYVPSNNKPKYIHKSYKSAFQEANRLKEKVCCLESVEILQIVNRFYGNDIF